VGADAQKNLSTCTIAFICDLRTGGASADDQHRPILKLIRIAV
jgi:hypothetical protein